MQIGPYELHPACVLLPPLAPEEFAKLRTSLAQFGQIEPIARYERDGTILDGRNRLLACLELGIEPRIETINPENPWEWVWSRNIDRRHLEAGRRAALRLEFDAGMRALVEAAAAAAAERKLRGLKRGQGRAPDADCVDAPVEFHEVPFPHAVAKLDAGAPEDTAREILATAAGVGTRTAGKALKIFQERPDLHAKVCAGEMPLEQADRERRRGATDADWQACEAYYSPAWVPQLLVGSGYLARPRLAVEPCVGDGSIVRALRGFARKWFTMDIRSVTPAHDGTHVTLSWLKAATQLSKRERQELAKADLVITNPAFSIAKEAVELAWELCPNAQVWILQRRTWHDAARADWFAEHQPDELNLSPRVRFCWPNGKPVGSGTDNSIHTWFGFSSGAAQPCAGPNGGISRTLIWAGGDEEGESE